MLRAYANYDKQIGYTQGMLFFIESGKENIGMNYIVGILLVILDPNNYKNSSLGKVMHYLREENYCIDYFKRYKNRYVEDTFWIFVHISYETNYRAIFKKEFPKLRGMMSNFSERLETKAPNIYHYLKEKDVY